MSGRKLFCTKCLEGFVVEGELPASCPKCHAPNWNRATHPTKRYTLTFNDKTFLKSIRVAQDE